MKEKGGGDLTTPLNSQKQFFPTASQRACKRVNDVTSANYFTEKSALIASENKRRERMHVIELEIKQQELVTKRKIDVFWDMATEKLQSCNNTATVMQTITAATTTQTTTAGQTMDLTELEVEYIDEPYPDDQGVAQQNEAIGSMRPADVADNIDEFVYQSPFRTENLYEDDMASTRDDASTPSVIDDEDADPSFDATE